MDNPRSSVTDWLAQLQAGERLAAQKIWERYFDRMTRLARRQLRAAPRRAANEEDIALEAFDGFCRAVEEGRYPDLHDRLGLWQVLLSLTLNKAVNLIKHEERAKRTWRRTVLHSELAGVEAGSDADSWPELFHSEEPDPAVAAELADRVHWLLERLEDDQLRRIARLKLEGHTNAEIAQQLDCALSTVERRLNLIRRRLEHHLLSPG